MKYEHDITIKCSRNKVIYHFKTKEEILNDVVKKVEIHWDNITNTHTIKIFFHLNIVKDRGSKVDDYVYKIIKGKSSTET